jgi:hypothetical protein
MLAPSRPADRLVHSLCVIASAAIVCTLFSRRLGRQPKRNRTVIDMTRVGRLQMWGRWLAVPGVN